MGLSDSLNDADADHDLDAVTVTYADADAYNKLLLVSEAEALFEEQLKSAGIDRAELFSELAPLFHGIEGHRYAVYLIHRHYELKPNERMVATKSSTKPSTESAPNIAPHIWSMDGVALEYRHFSSRFPVPPRPLSIGFRSVLKKMGIDTLGICYFDDYLADDHIYEEGDGPGDRERVVSIIPASLAPTDSYEVMWSPRYNQDTQSLVMAVRCCCNGVGCWTTTIGPVVSLTLQPNTIATIFGAVQDAAVKKQIVLAQLFGKGVVLEKTVNLDGPKSGPYHVVGDEKDYAIVWGPFTEKKMIQVALYWNNPHNSALEPIDKGGLKEFSDDKLRIKVTLIPIYSKDKDGNVTLRTVVNVARMGVKA